MSTRSNIIIKDGNQKVILYHHWDGYPSGVGVTLLHYFMPLTDTNIENLYVEGVANDLIKLKEDNGFEIALGLCGWMEYLYTIDLKKNTLVCQSIYDKKRTVFTYHLGDKVNFLDMDCIKSKRAIQDLCSVLDSDIPYTCGDCVQKPFSGEVKKLAAQLGYSGTCIYTNEYEDRELNFSQSELPQGVSKEEYACQIKDAIKENKDSILLFKRTNGFDIYTRDAFFNLIRNNNAFAESTRVQAFAWLWINGKKDEYLY